MYIYICLCLFFLFLIIPILFRGASGLREAEYVTRPIVRLVPINAPDRVTLHESLGEIVGIRRTKRSQKEGG